MERAVRWIVSGRVQGVGFRWFVARHAAMAKLRGWASNLPDGRVEIVAAGGEDVIRELGEHLQVGPPSAIVERVEKEDISHDIVDCKSFYIR